MRSLFSRNDAKFTETAPFSIDWINMFEAVGHPTMILDSNHIILKSNSATLLATGLEEKEVVGKKCFEVFHHTHEPPRQCPMQTMNESGHFESEVMEVEALGGWFMISCTPIYNNAKKLKTIIHVATDISQQKKAEFRISKELDEKRVLLREIHHRVKNNLQVISSLINLQVHQMDDPRLRAAFEETQNRIRSMAFIHQELYQADDFTAIPLTSYIGKLVHHLYGAYNLDPDAIKTSITADPVRVSLDFAMPLGLIMNELISNALKYAFPDEKYLPGRVDIALTQSTEGSITLMIRDNGIGLPETVDIHNTPSFGMHLLVMLVEDQLGGRIEVQRNQGTVFNIFIPMKTQCNEID